MQRNYNDIWVKDACVILNIKHERVMELINDIDQQIYVEMYTEIENMRNEHSRFHSKQLLKYLNTNNKDNNQNKNTKDLYAYIRNIE